MSVTVRPAASTDRDEWLRLRTELWPQSAGSLLDDIERFFDQTSDNLDHVYVAEAGAGQLVGFIELRLRNYAEGSSRSTVPYIEGWYVEPEFRNLGVGALLINAVEKWAVASGFSEIASDAELDNEGSHAAHAALGFVEQERLVCFLKQLK